jgi:cysteinyl-tRNA synthetase
VVIVNELVSTIEVADDEKYALLAAWDHVLGLDLEREAKSVWKPTDEMRALMAERDSARAARDFAAADELRDRLDGIGLEVMDTPEGTKVRPRDQR